MPLHDVTLKLTQLNGEIKTYANHKYDIIWLEIRIIINENYNISYVHTYIL